VSEVQYQVYSHVSRFDGQVARAVIAVRPYKEFGACVAQSVYDFASVWLQAIGELDEYFSCLVLRYGCSCVIQL
jgi:hypothetical protein